MKTAALIAAQHRGLSFADAVERYLGAKLTAFRIAFLCARYGLSPERAALVARMA